MAANGVRTVAFEPQPSNLYYLTNSLLALKEDERRLVTLHPTGLGSTRGSHVMFAQAGNEGNSVLDAVVPDNDAQALEMGNHKYNVHVDTLDEVLWPRERRESGHLPPNVPLLKLDVQGFEEKVLRGATHLLAARAIGAIKTELAGKWLRAQGTTPRRFCAQLEAYGFRLSSVDGKHITLDGCEQVGDGVSDLFARQALSSDRKTL